MMEKNDVAEDILKYCISLNKYVEMLGMVVVGLRRTRVGQCIYCNKLYNFICNAGIHNIPELKNTGVQDSFYTSGRWAINFLNRRVILE